MKLFTDTVGIEILGAQYCSINIKESDKRTNTPFSIDLHYQNVAGTKTLYNQLARWHE